MLSLIASISSESDQNASRLPAPIGANTPDFASVQVVQAAVVLFTVVFVLLTLLVNAPMLTYVLKWTGLSVVPKQHVKMRAKAVHLLAKHTEQILKEMRDDDDEMLRGACHIAHSAGL